VPYTERLKYSSREDGIKKRNAARMSMMLDVHAAYIGFKYK
jgi:hypothetical protein